MQRVLMGLGLWLWVVVAPLCQQFSSPADLVDTLYDSYFSGVVIDDFAPYFSDGLTRQMDGRVGMSEFEALGFDPIVGDPQWAPRNFRITAQDQTRDTAQVEVSFDTRNVPVSLKMTLVREPAHGWQIDHIAGKAGTHTWCTNDIIALSPAKASTSL